MSQFRLNVTAKVMIGVAAILVVMLSVNFWVSNSRVNKQAEAAFVDKLRQITGMATTTRAWMAAHQQAFAGKVVDGKPDINTVPVVAAWQIAQQYSDGVNFEFKTPSLSPRNPDNSADSFEREALLAFQKDSRLTEFHRRENVNDREFIRFAVPVRVEQACLECHGSPAGEKDAFGFAKEGMQVGELRAAFSVKAPATELAANEAANAKFGLLAAFLTLCCVSIGIFFMVRKSVSRPLAEISDKMVAISMGDVNQTLTYRSDDEIGVVAVAFTSLADYIKDVSRAAERIAQGDLTVEVKPRSDRDLLGKSFMVMTTNLEDMVRRLNDDANKLAAAATEIAAAAEQMASGSREQQGQAGQVSAAVQEMTANVQQSANGADKAAELSRGASNTAKDGTQVVHETIDGMQRIADVVTEASQTIGKLSKSSEAIGEITSVIDDIADQTNLLALNAAIEAARAGEQGRGFAVVADEVRKLAERTGKATKEISDMIKSIQRETEQAVIGMDQGLQEVSAGRDLADKAGKSLDQILTMASSVSDMIQQLARNAEEQSVAAEEISKSIEHISNVTRESSVASEQSAKAATDLSHQAENLKTLVSRFKVRS
jgi:methyl-accepting chemotaxis protein